MLRLAKRLVARLIFACIGPELDDIIAGTVADVQMSMDRFVRRAEMAAARAAKVAPPPEPEDEELDDGAAVPTFTGKSELYRRFGHTI